MSDILNNITQFISEQAEKVGRKTDEVLAIQGLKGQIRNSNREIEKHYSELGKLIVAKYLEGGEISDEEKAHCEEVERLTKLIEQYEADIDAYKAKTDDYDDIWEEEEYAECEACEVEDDPAEEAAAACEEKLNDVVEAVEDIVEDSKDE